MRNGSKQEGDEKGKMMKYESQGRESGKINRLKRLGRSKDPVQRNGIKNSQRQNVTRNGIKEEGWEKIRGEIYESQEEDKKTEEKLKQTGKKK